jgi:hypothetical protein
VYDQAELAKEILPKFFKHSNFASFVRQLNMYGFRKIVSADQGSLRSAEREHMEFSNPNFQRNKPNLLEYVKRKISSNVRTASDEQKVKSEHVEQLLLDVHEMKDRQIDVNQQIEALTKDKQTMWEELSRLRQKSDQQQLVINKLIHFLLRLLYTKTDRIGSIGRKRPLALLEADPTYSSAKIVALPDQSSNREADGVIHTLASPSTTDTNTTVPDIVMQPSPTRVAVPVSVESGTLLGSTSGTDGTNAVMYSSSTAIPAVGGSYTGSPEVVYHRPQAISIQPPTDMRALQNWDLSPTNNIASLLCDAGSVVPQAPDCPATDISSLMEHLDSLDEGLDSVRNVFETSAAFDCSVVTDLFTPDLHSPSPTLDNNTQVTVKYSQCFLCP